MKDKKAVAISITEDSVGDNKEVLLLIDAARKRGTIAKALLDGAYDTFEIWNGLHARGIRSLIRLRKNAVVNNKSPTRSQEIKCYQGNEKEWAKATGFGQRWQAETLFSSFKRRFGENCTATRPQNVIPEILFKAMLCNWLIS
ncbi:transposase [Candidatus Woesearchaeota archaeon]|nr:transposase [Candidatus Woesearchaeota archaeon]